MHHVIIIALVPIAEPTIKMWVKMSPAERTYIDNHPRLQLIKVDALFNSNPSLTQRVGMKPTNRWCVPADEIKRQRTGLATINLLRPR